MFFYDYRPKFNEFVPGDDDLPGVLDDRANIRSRVHASIRTRLKFHGTARHESQDNPWFQGQAAF